jgi:hypothetical protein
MLDVVESHVFITVTVAVTAVRDTLYTFTVSTLLWFAPHFQPPPDMPASHIGSVTTRILPQNRDASNAYDHLLDSICSHAHFSPLMDQHDVPMQRLWSPSAVSGMIRPLS